MYLNFRYIKSTNESSSLKTQDLNGSITGKYYLNFGRENKFQHAFHHASSRLCAMHTHTTQCTRIQCNAHAMHTHTTQCALNAH